MHIRSLFNLADSACGLPWRRSSPQRQEMYSTHLVPDVDDRLQPYLVEYLHSYR